MEKIMRQLSNCSWVEIGEQETTEIFDEILSRETWYAARVGREPMTTHEDIRAHLLTGKEIRYDSEWYDNIKIMQPTPKPVENNVLCGCGCTVPKAQVMMGNYGTVCPNCYDEEDE